MSFFPEAFDILLTVLRGCHGCLPIHEMSSTQKLHARPFGSLVLDAWLLIYLWYNEQVWRMGLLQGWGDCPAGLPHKHQCRKSGSQEHPARCSCSATPSLTREATWSTPGKPRGAAVISTQKKALEMLDFIAKRLIWARAQWQQSLNFLPQGIGLPSSGQQAPLC